MTTLLLLAQGAFSVYVVSLAFGTGAEFWITVLVNAVLVAVVVSNE